MGTSPTTPGVGAATTEPGMPPEPGATPGMGTPEPQTAPGMPATPAAQPMTDAEIALVLQLANQSEVEQGKLAQTRARNARVKKFATMMVNDHGGALKEQQTLVTKLGIQPDESTLSSRFASDSSTQLATLRDATTDFDRVYIDTQVEVHTKVLDTIDSQLLPNVQNQELKALLTKQRGVIEMHLKEARDIQQSLAAAGMPGGAPKPPGPHSH